MHSLISTFKQHFERFNERSAATRFAVGALVFLVAASACWLAFAPAKDSRAFILGKLTPGQVRTAERALGMANLSDFEFVGGNQLRVPNSLKAVYLKALSDGGAIPASLGDEKRKSLESMSFFESFNSRSERIEAGGEAEFALTIEDLEQIDLASVEFNRGESVSFAPPKSTCFISVKRFGNQQIERKILHNIAVSATAYFPALQLEDVCVLDCGTGTIYRGTEDFYVGGNNPVLQAEVEWEEHIYRKLREQLAGYGDARISVSVRVSPRLMEQSERLTYDSTPAPTEVYTSRRLVDSANDHQQGRAESEPDLIERALNSPQSLVEETSHNQYGSETRIQRTAGLVPTAVAVSVGIPESYYRKVYEHQQSMLEPSLGGLGSGTPRVPTPAELERVREQVNGAALSAIQTIQAGFAPLSDKDIASVYAYPDIPMEALEPRSMPAVTPWSWLMDSWQNVAIVVGVLFTLALLMGVAIANWFRSRMAPKRTKQAAESHASAIDFHLEIPEQLGDELDLSEDSQPESSAASDDVQTDLSRLVKENPDAAGDLIKSWLGEAA